MKYNLGRGYKVLYREYNFTRAQNTKDSIYSNNILPCVWVPYVAYWRMRVWLENFTMNTVCSVTS